MSENSTHTECTILNSSLFGNSPSCMLEYFGEISLILEGCQRLAPQWPLGILFLPETKEELITHGWFPLVSIHDQDSSYDFPVKINRLRELINVLAHIPTIKHQLSLCLKQHINLLSSCVALQVLDHLLIIQKVLIETKFDDEEVFFQWLDNHSNEALAKLDSIMKKVLYLSFHQLLESLR